MNDFPQRLRELRSSVKATQKHIALSIGISERGYQEYELSKKEPTLGKLVAIADFFDVSLDYLVGRSDNPERR